MRQDKTQNTEVYAAHQQKKHRLRTVGCLAAAVVLCTAYTLIRPALAQEIQCTIPEHVHTDACYTQMRDAETEEGETVQVLTCGMEEHTHTEACFSKAEDDTEANGAAGANVASGGSGGAAEISAIPETDTSKAIGTLDVSLLYEDQKPQSEHAEGLAYYTRATMSGYLKLEPNNLDADLTDVTVTLSIPKQYVEKDSIKIPNFSTNASNTEYEILPVTEDAADYKISILFTAYDKTQTLVLPFTLSFLDNVVPDNYQLPVSADVSRGEETLSTAEPIVYKPLYKDWGIQKFVNSNRLDAFGRDGAEAVVTPLEEGGNPYLDDRTYVDFAFIVNQYTNVNCSLDDWRDASEVTLTDTLPTYIDKDGESCIAVFDADKNPGWTLSEDGKTVSKTYSGENSSDVLLQIYGDQLHLRFPGLKFETTQDGSLFADLTNTVSLNAVPSNEAKGETHPTAEDSLRFRLTNDTGTGGVFSKHAAKGNIYDVDAYKTNPYPWSLALTNKKMQPLRHIRIQDRKITEDGKTVLAGLDEALKFVRVESNTAYSTLPEGKTYADLVEKVVAYYTDGTTEEFLITEADASGNFTVTFDENEVCDGYEIIFKDAYEMQFGESVNFLAYTVYRDPQNTHVPEGEEKVNYANAARSVNSYQNGDETVYVYLNAAHNYDMLPTTETLSVSKLTLCNDGKTTLAGRGGNHVGDCYLYQVTLTGSLLQPEVKQYEDLRIVDLLPDGVHYDSIYLVQSQNSILEGGTKYQPEIIEDYHNSGRTAVIFHLNAEELRSSLDASVSHFVSLYFWVKIDEDAHNGTVRNFVYVVGDNLDEYQKSTGGTKDIYDLNNNGRTDDQIAYSYSDATIIAAQSIYAEKFIAPAGSDNWTKHGLYLKAGTDFDYLLKVTNETKENHTGLVAYDTLPQIGDNNIFATATRNSEFHVQLRKAISAPDGYTVFYTTSPDVYEKTMEEMVSANVWTEAVSDYSAVTGFKLVANTGTVLAGESDFKVRIPVQTPSAFGAASMNLLHAKTDTDQSSGTMSYLEAINSFGFKTDQAASAKASNDVWARVPFAGFCVKKADGESGEALAGAEFTLKDAAGNVVGTAVSDAQGFLCFRELTEGTYTLTETKVPQGYMDKNISITVTITQNPVTMEYTVSFDGPYTGTGTAEDPLVVLNYTTYELPAAGGIGTSPFYLLGGSLIVLASVLLIARGRMNG